MRYLEVMFYAPLRFMRSMAIRTLDLARESSHPKGLRGGRSASCGATARFRLTLQMRLVRQCLHSRR
jgi:hypothetical protein